jgi:hypothetical protein
MDKVEYCWAKALECTKHAEDTTDDEVREFFYRLREAWIRAADHQEVFAGAPTIPVSESAARA